MDPDANITEQLSIARAILRTWDNCSEDGELTAEQYRAMAQDANRLAELIQALDGWITSGGFLPELWRSK
jgi:hypothetical protein